MAVLLRNNRETKRQFVTVNKNEDLARESVEGEGNVSS